METNSHHASSILIQIQTSSREEPPREDSPHQIIELHASGHPDNKRRGEASEAEFIARACALDFRIAKPWGESDPYDILVGMGHGFWRVQVKRAPYSRQGQYVARAGGCTGHYTKENIDFIAAHLLQENIWYLVPVEAFQGRKMLHFHPKPRSRSKYEKYREAWCLLACDPKARGWKDIPVLCRCKDLPLRCAVCPNQYRTNQCGTDKCGTDTPVRRL